MTRMVVAGGTGFFGGALVEMLRDRGHAPLVAARQRGDLLLDVEDAASIRGVLQPGDLVVDAVGPFQGRSTALVEAAVALGCHVVDLSDSLGYLRSLRALESLSAASSSRVFSACSSMSVISAAALTWSGLDQPTRVRSLLVPAMRQSRARATALSLLASLGQPIEVFSEGRLQARRGWQDGWTLRLAGRRCHGRLFETVDALTLPAAWPSLQEVTSYVDPNVVGMGWLLSLAARFSGVRWMMLQQRTLGLAIGRLLARSRSGIGYEIQSGGETVVVIVSGTGPGHRIALAPTLLAVERVIAGDLPAPGLVPADQQVDPQQLRGFLEEEGWSVSIE